MNLDLIEFMEAYQSGQTKRSFDHLQHLIMAMADTKKNYGKRSLFGADKGKKHFDNFVDLLLPQLVIMMEEGIISRHEDPNVICDKLHMMNFWFVQAFPLWQDAFEFSQSFFQENKQIASDIISTQINKIYPR
jgi:hypothetical protein